MFDTVPNLQCGHHVLKLDVPRIMAIVNVTPDSFSDGGRLDSTASAVSHAMKLAEQGADMLDIGGESTRPNAEPVSLQEELDRVIPVIEALSARCSLPISIDTSKPEVMRAAVAAGAGFINDVYALRQEGALEAAASLGVAVCLMHMPGNPRTMQKETNYDDVLVQVRQFLTERMFACEMAGIAKKNLVIDPGFGFGKLLEHNLALLANLSYFCELGVPVLAGVSRKSMIGQITGRDVDSRISGSAAAAMLAAQSGAGIIRVHDVAETKDALAVLAAVQAAKRKDHSTKPKPSIQWPDED
ncbi:dihydropteroate synthase [Arenimonas sp. GDDSR-1]|uniref:dihydropteroate synthase n=1 Tax=Arenimonas sp. GDDSR-1 TaxID=2950125 RepID=UPI00261A0F34|nr:dihydropteroate synthase [Arenimonas sp. GDDSR-1]